MLNLWLNFVESQPIYAYKHYAYKKECILAIKYFHAKNQFEGKM